MAIDPPPLPTKEDALGFVKLIDSARVKRNFLANSLPMYDNEAIRETITNHIVFYWAHRQVGFHKVVRRIREKNSILEHPAGLEIDIAYCLARTLHMFLVFTSNPERIKRTTGTCSGNALKHIESLQDLMETDIQMENFMDFVELARLLEKLKLELSGEAQTTYIKSSKGDVLGRKLTVELYQQINELLDEVPASLISDLLSEIHPVTEQSAHRYIKVLSEKH